MVSNIATDSYNELIEKYNHVQDALFSDTLYSGNAANLAGQDAGALAVLVLETYTGVKSATVVARGVSDIAKNTVKRIDNAVTRSVDDALDSVDGAWSGRVSGSGEVGDALSHTPSRYRPDISANMQDNIDETLNHITNGRTSADVPNRISQNWGGKYDNNDNVLPDLGENGYKEYRVRGENRQDNVHRIVVGKDGNYYYTDTHYGDNPGQPFHYGGRLTPEQVQTTFGINR